MFKGEFIMEIKWFVIMAAILFGSLSCGMAIDEWHKSDCKIEYAKSNRSAAEIREICR